MKTLQDYIDKLNSLNFKEMYENDFFLTWEKTDEELEAVWTVADALRYMRENNISTKVFESGLGTVSYIHLDVYKRQPRWRKDCCGSHQSWHDGQTQW